MKFEHMHIRNESYEVTLKDITLMFTAGRLVGVSRVGSTVAIFDAAVLSNSTARKHTYQWRSPDSYQHIHLPQQQFEDHVCKMIGLNFKPEAQHNHDTEQPAAFAAARGVVD